MYRGKLNNILKKIIMNLVIILLKMMII